MKWRLRLMMLFEYAIWGAWYVTVGTWLGQTLHFSGKEIGAIAGTTAIGAMISPLFIGLVADRLFDTRRVLAVLHVIGAVLLVLAAQQSSFAVLYVALLAYSLCYMPTLALTTSLAMRHVSDPQEEFGAIRVAGSIGWIVVGLIVGAWGVEATAAPLHLAAGLSLAMAVYCLTLPPTPPLARDKRFEIRHVLPLESLHLLRDRSMAIFALASFLICIPLQFYYAFTNLFLNDIGVVNAAGKMTGGQMSEILCMLLIPWFFRRLGVKYMLAVGMLAWVVRYAMFAFGGTGELMWMLWLGIILHGICFDFFFVVGQIYIDREAPSALRAATQGLITFLTYGLGMFVGSWLSGMVVDTYTRTNAQGAVAYDWHAIWLIAGACAAVVLVLFVLLFKDRKATLTPPGEPFMMTRRQFLARSALSGAAAWLTLGSPGKLLAATSKGKALGIQLYMVLDAYKNDPVGALKTLKSIGYTEIEAIVTSTAKTLRDQLNETGLRSPSLHFDSLGFESGLDAAHVLGSKYIVSSMLPAIMQKAKGSASEPTYTLDDAKRTAEYANRLGEKARQAGLQYAYHNHHLEFTDVVGGQTFYDVLLKETDHKLVQFELDCGWVHAGGKNPADYFKANPGRIPLMHAKDFLPNGGKDFPGAELGRGTLDYKPIMAAADAAGLKHCFVEQEGPYARMSQLDAARVDYAYLRPLR